MDSMSMVLQNSHWLQRSFWCTLISHKFCWSDLESNQTQAHIRKNTQVTEKCFDNWIHLINMYCLHKNEFVIIIIGHINITSRGYVFCWCWFACWGACAAISFKGCCGKGWAASDGSVSAFKVATGSTSSLGVFSWTLSPGPRLPDWELSTFSHPSLSLPLPLLEDESLSFSFTVVATLPAKLVTSAGGVDMPSGVPPDSTRYFLSDPSFLLDLQLGRRYLLNFLSGRAAKNRMKAPVQELSSWKIG